jgi:hypothetical protein
MGAPPTKTLTSSRRPFGLDELERLPLHVHGGGEQRREADDLRLVLADRRDEVLGGHRDAQVHDREAGRLHHHRHDLLADVVQVALHGTHHDGAHLLGLLGDDERLEQAEGHLHALGRHHHLGQEVLVHLEAPADLGDAGGHRPGDQRARRDGLGQQRLDERRGPAMLPVDDVPLEDVEEVLDLGGRIRPAVGLARVLDVVLQVLQVLLFVGVDCQCHVATSSVVSWSAPGSRGTRESLPGARRQPGAASSRRRRRGCFSDQGS